MAVAHIQTPTTRWWHTRDDGRIVCTLCPRYCTLKPGQAGFCFIRQNQDGKLVSKGYGRPIALNVDPIEKKPLFHFYPGSKILSLGTAGCNMGCKFCQNWDISHATENYAYSRTMLPEDVVNLAIHRGVPHLAFTYNEPTIFGEYVIDMSMAGHEHGLHTVMVTNGYITPEAIKDIYPHIDAANIDLKAFTEDFYRKITLSSLKPVLEAIVQIRAENTWVELTTLLIPELNTGPQEIREMSQWIIRNLGADTPLHFSAFHPDYKLMDKPATSIETLTQAYEIARDAGLQYVYLGNVVTDKGNTHCPGCGKIVIRRNWYDTHSDLLPGGLCPHCQAQLPGCF